MPAVLSPFRLKELAYDGTYQKHHEARVDFDLETVDLAVVFGAVAGNIFVGDQVTFCAYEGSDFSRLRQVRSCRIVAKEPGKAPVGAWVGPTWNVPEEVLAGPVKAKDAKLVMKKEFGGGFTIQDERGAVVERVKTKAEAEAYVKRINGGDELRDEKAA
jgi:hypothetical protein